MRDSPLRTMVESVDATIYDTPTKSASMMTTTIIGNEENEQNGIDANDRLLKRVKAEHTPKKEAMGYSSMMEIDGPSHHHAEEDHREISSFRGRLGEIEPPQPQNYSTTRPAIPRSANKVPRPPRATSTAAASTLVRRLVDKHPDSKQQFTPVRCKPKFKKEDVQATNDGYASVAKLSAWLADDPTSNKQVRNVRKGRNVIAKSRRFEKDLEDVVIEECDISKGAVSDKKNWLTHAFHEQHDDDDDLDSVGGHSAAARYVQSEVGGYRGRACRGSFENSSRSEIVIDDAASSLSVSDKKDWLKNAFKKAEGGTPSRPVRPTTIPKKANSDIVHNRGRDEVTARAKQKWAERSARRLMEKNETKQEEGRRTIAPSPSSTSSVPAGRTGFRHNRNSTSGGSNVEPPKSTVAVDEDKTPVDFRAARELLIKRSKANGNELYVMNKVQKRKQKFESMEKEVRRRSGSFGLLKPSWDENDVSQGPSDGYSKKYIDDPAPRKSIDELP